MSDLDRPSLFNGLRRHAKTTAVAGGLAARVAAKRLGFGEGLTENHAQDLVLALGALKGPLVKIAQFLSSIPGFLPDGYAQELRKLQSNAPPMGGAFVRRRLKNELGASWEKLFCEFDKDAYSAASLGQVHKARLTDGTQVACKLQYPAMDSVIETDLKQLKTVLSVYEVFGSAIRQGEVFRELSDRLREELDYRREARNLDLYREIMKDSDTPVKIPAVFDPPQSDRLLTMEWMDGLSFDKFLALNPSQEVRNRAARGLFLAWYVPFYRYGVVHGDPHPGNFLFSPEGDVTLLDLGSVRIFPPRFVYGVVSLYRMMASGETENAHEAYKDWGFKDLSPAAVEALNQWAMFFFKPLLHDAPSTITELSNFAQAQEILSEVHSALKKAGGVTLPAEFVLLDRSAIGLGSAFIRLDAVLNWAELFREAVGADFSLERVAERQKTVLDRARMNEKGEAIDG